MVKLIPQIRACNKQLDELKNLIDTAHASNIDVAQTEKLHSDLSLLSATAEKIALAGQEALITPEEKKARKYQVYLGNHQPTEKVSTELANIDDLLASLANIKAIQENQDLANYLAIATLRVNSFINTIK